MTAAGDALARGNQLLARGDAAGAAAAYREALRLQPDVAEAHHNLGNALLLLGRPAEAVGCYREAVRLSPAAGVGHYGLGHALLECGQLTEAAQALRQAVTLQPAFAEAHYRLGVALAGLGRWAEAEAACRQALAAQPGHAGAQTYLGHALREQGRKEEAVACYQAAVALRPGAADAHNNLGVTLGDLGRWEEAAACYREALRLRPEFAKAHNNLGNAVRALGRPEEAEACYREAVRLQPDYADAQANRGVALAEAGRADLALTCYAEALRLRPDAAETLSNLADALADLGRFDEALARCDESLRLRPDNPLFHWNRALLRLTVGDFSGGWPELEWRRQIPGLAPRALPQPAWDGAPLAGRTILLHAEQGFGDTIQFARYVPLVNQRGGTVILECQPELARLLTTLPGVDRVVARGDPLPPFDVQAPLLSLPGLFGTTADMIPARVPYVTPEPELVARWQHELGGGFRVGIVWQGNPRHRRDRFRSVPIRAFAALGMVPGVRLVSLQKGAGTEQFNELAGAFAVEDVGSRCDDFAETAAAIRCVDLVIAVDTAVAHLAGALGVPAWVALPFRPDWRWLLGREDSPWYPTMHLFRQRRPGDWDEAFGRMAAALADAAGGTP